jgi:NADPH-dependent ferric siderophore reductase
MASLKSLLRNTLGQLVFKELSVEAVRDVSAHFRRLRVSGESLRSAGCAAGDKVQVMVPEAGPRTYTPFSHDAASGSMELLAFVHGDTPASRWARQLSQGARFRAFGPRGSLPLAALRGPVVLFGDETSFAAAKALHDVRGDDDGLALIFESTQRDEAALVLRDLGLEQHALVPRQIGDSHLDAVESHVRDALARLTGAQLVLTGHAQSIQALRARLRARPAAHTGQKVKAYWADGKAGLD